MQLGMIGLGRMGGNMIERCMRDGHKMYHLCNRRRCGQKYEGLGAVGVSSIEDLVSKLSSPRYG